MVIVSVVVYGMVRDYEIDLHGCSRNDVIKLIKPGIDHCFFPEDYNYVVINVEEGEVVQ